MCKLSLCKKKCKLSTFLAVEKALAQLQLSTSVLSYALLALKPDLKIIKRCGEVLTQHRFVESESDKEIEKFAVIPDGLEVLWSKI